VPVIFITAHDDASTRARLEKSTAAAHLKKPFDSKTVVGAIRRVTGGIGWWTKVQLDGPGMSATLRVSDAEST
jgi:DNA-binding response OmpR family regulator